MSVALWSFVAPHGVLELPAIFIAGGAGLLLGRGDPASRHAAAARLRSPRPGGGDPAAARCGAAPDRRRGDRRLRLADQRLVRRSKFAIGASLFVAASCSTSLGGRAVRRRPVRPRSDSRSLTARGTGRSARAVGASGDISSTSTPRWRSRAAAPRAGRSISCAASTRYISSSSTGTAPPRAASSGCRITPNSTTCRGDRRAALLDDVGHAGGLRDLGQPDDQRALLLRRQHRRRGAGVIRFDALGLHVSPAPRRSARRCVAPRPGASRVWMRRP